MAPRASVWSVAALLATTSPGCGGGSSGSTTESFLGVAAVDGFVTFTGLVLTSSTSGIYVGDNIQDDFARGFFRFAHPSIPSGATIVKATLRVYQYASGGAPFTDLGSFAVIDHMDLGASLDLADAAGPALSSDIGVLSADMAIGFRSLEVTARVQDDVNANRATSDFRVRFAAGTDGGADDDFVAFIDAEDSPGSGGLTPSLLVTWK